MGSQRDQVSTLATQAPPLQCVRHSPLTRFRAGTQQCVHTATHFELARHINLINMMPTRRGYLHVGSTQLPTTQGIAYQTPPNDLCQVALNLDQDE